MSDPESNQKMLEKVRAEKPQSFTIGAHADILAKNADTTATYNRKLRNGLGLTAYLKAWWNDAAVIPNEKKGVTVGVEGKIDF